jgi:hypothetical protein
VPAAVEQGDLAQVGLGIGAAHLVHLLAREHAPQRRVVRERQRRGRRQPRVIGHRLERARVRAAAQERDVVSRDLGRHQRGKPAQLVARAKVREARGERREPLVGGVTVRTGGAGAHE